MNKTKVSSVTCIPPEKNLLLIGEVRKFPSLYDTCDPNYYVLAERNKAWLQVAVNCDLPAELCHLRWKSLRKRYAKERRRFPEILQGQRRPWALFPKMAFLTSSTLKRRVRPGVRPRAKIGSKKLPSVRTDGFKQNTSDDDMLILNDKDEILHTCKSVDVSEEDEYIYDTLDDPDSALEIIKSSPNSKMKATAIRSGGAAGIPLAIQTRGPARIRRPTPKMQNSLIAKKLKQAQMVAHHVPSGNVNTKSNVVDNKTARLQKVVIDHCKDANTNKNVAKTVLYQDKTTRHVATVNPNIIRVEKIGLNEETISSPPNLSDTSTGSTSKRDSETSAAEGNRPFKVIKLKGRNPIIFSPEQLPDIKSFLKSESSSNKEQTKLKTEVESPEKKSPVIKIKSVDNLNNQSTSPIEDIENRNLDIIHSVGLVRKTTAEKSTSVEKTILPHQSYSRSYSWNRPLAKQTHTSTNNRNKQTAPEKIQPDSQTKDYEIEETWNDIKEETIVDDDSWTQSSQVETFNPPHDMFLQTPESVHRVNSWNRVNEAKLELVSFQRKLLEEQHKKNLEYMKKEHDLKMTLLKAEIDLKRKQLNIML